MREILFRGKRLDDGEWVYGGYFKDGDSHYMPQGIGSAFVQVIPETVGQFTGLLDKKGNKIFEGDILQFDNKYEWYKGSFTKWWSMTSEEKQKWIDEQPYYRYVVKYDAPEYNLSRSECENYYVVIGNIHDNDELYKKIKGVENGK